MEEIFIGNTDRFGYYQVGNQKIYSKYDAIKLHEKTGLHPEWRFNDEVFACYNWSQEPTESLSDLYRLRAEQLREQYDHIVLLFSGGADSTNVLDTFVNNDIHLDEIVSFQHYEGNQNRFTHTDAEVTNVAIPYVQKILERRPNIKFRLLDLSRPIYNFYKSSANMEYNMQYMMTMNARPEQVKYKIYEIDPEYLDLIHSGHKVCFLIGKDKPRIQKIGDKWTLKFIDLMGDVATSGKNIPVEYFYWTANLPKLVIKQAHIIKKYLELADANSQFISTSPKGVSFKQHNGQTLWLTNDGTHSLLYPTWNIDTFSVGKARSMIFGEKTKWMHQDQLDTVSVNWKKMVDAWWKSIPDYWKNDPNNMHKGIKGMWSRSYELN